MQKLFSQIPVADLYDTLFNIQLGDAFKQPVAVSVLWAQGRLRQGAFRCPLRGRLLRWKQRTLVFSARVVAYRFASAPRAMPNPSIERTRTGMALQAFISFWALRALPARAAHVKR